MHVYKLRFDYKTFPTAPLEQVALEWHVTARDSHMEPSSCSHYMFWWPVPVAGIDAS